MSGVFLVLLAGFAPTNPSAIIERDQQAEVGKLVRRLGSDNFKVREQASQRLRQIGLPARQALLEGAKDPDLEIRRRCRDLLPAILEADRQVKLAAFLADKDGKQKHDLPGWERYRKIAGEDVAARTLFVAMQKQESDFLQDADKDPTRIGSRCGSLCMNLTQRQQVQFRGGAASIRQASLAEMATLLFVAGDPRVNIPQEHRYLFTNLLYQGEIQNALRNGSSVPLKKIVLSWMERQIEDDNNSLMLFNAINQMGLKEGLELALKVVKDKKRQGSSVAPALVTIGRFGDKQYVPLLEKYLDDKTGIGGFGFGRAKGGNVNGSTEVRDAALASLVRLTKQEHKDYGFAITELDPPLTFLLDQANCLGFSSEERRTKAFAKWKTWKEAQKKASPADQPRGTGKSGK